MSEDQVKEILAREPFTLNDLKEIFADVELKPLDIQPFVGKVD